MRIIAIDYGKKRCGLATTDPEQIIATHLDTIDTPNLLTYLKKYAENEAIEGFVIGKPFTLSGVTNPIYEDIKKLRSKIETAFPDMFIDEIDERFTSKMAFQSIIDSGVNKKKRRDKAQIDMVSAVIILQNYLAKKENLS